MKILILNRLSLQDVDYVEIFKESGAKLFLITTHYSLNTGKPDNSEMLSRYDRIAVIKDFDSDGAVESQAARWISEHRFDAVVANSESDVVRAARIREHAGIQGDWTEQALAFRDKLRMKAVAQAAGIRVAPYAAAGSFFDLLEFARDRDLPLVVKDRFGMASEQVHILQDQGALEVFLRTGFPNRPGSSWLCEEFLRAGIFHVDAVLLHGEQIAAGCAEYLSGCLAYRDHKAMKAFYLDEGDAAGQEMIRSAMRYVAAVNPRFSGVIHAEFFYDGGPILCEIASRPGFGGINDAFMRQYGLGLFVSAALTQAGLSPGAPVPCEEGKRFGYIEIPYLSGKTLLSFPSLAELERLGVLSHHASFTPGTYFGQIYCSANELIRVILAASSREEFIGKTGAVEDWFSRGTLWQGDEQV